MAQYGYNIYGTSVYGKTNAISGLFISREVDVGEELTTNLMGQVIAELPTAVYYATDSEFIYKTGEWTQQKDGSMKTEDGTAILVASFSKYKIKCQGKGTYTLRKRSDDGWITVDSGEINSPDNVIIIGPDEDIEYEAYEVELSGALTIYNADTTTGGINLYLRTGKTRGELRNSEYQKATISKKVKAIPSDVEDLYPEAQEITPDTFRVTYETDLGMGCRYYQFKLELLTSDDRTSPFVKELMMYCGDVNVFNTNGGEWTAVVDMGSSFSEYDTIEWESTEEDGTSVTIQTATSIDKTNWGNMSNPYTKTKYQARLQENKRKGYIKVPTMTPRHLKKWLQLTSKYYDAQTPSDLVNPVRIQFYDANTDKPVGHEMALNSNLESLLVDNVAVPMYAHIILERLSTNDNTPFVDWIQAIAQCEYTQLKSFSSSVSRVYGEKNIHQLSKMGFTDLPEPEYGDVDYTIKLFSNGKQVQLYWASERDKEFRNNTISTLGDNTLCAVSFEPYYYNYGSTIVYFNGEPTTKKVLMSNAFLPAMDTSLKYQYKVFNKWVRGEELETIDRYVTDGFDIYWEQPIDQDHKDITEVSEINAGLIGKKSANDRMILRVSWGDDVRYIPWRSKEIIVPGSPNSYAVVNANGLEIPYYNDNVPLPEIEQYVFVEPDCYKVEIIPGSIKRNGVPVPEQEFDLKYDIVYADDLYKKDGTPYLEYVVADKIVRGQGPTDRLRYNYIDTVLGVWNNNVPIGTSTTIADYKPGLDYTIDIESSTIDWSPHEELSREPKTGETYYVHYVCRKPLYARVEISCDYKEKKTIKNGIWKSQKEYSYTGECYPGVDYESANLHSIIPQNKDYWEDLPDEVSNLEYTVIDDNIWVETTVENISDTETRIRGSLGLRDPQKNWYPKIKSGFYYIGKDEFYHYLDPKTVTIGADKIEYAENISFKESPLADEGIAQGAVLVEEGSVNLIANSDLSVSKQGLKHISDFSTFTDIKTASENKPIEWPQG